MADDAGPKPTNLQNNIYGVDDAVEAYIESCRQFLAHAQKAQAPLNNSPALNRHLSKPSSPGKGDNLNPQDLQVKQESLNQLEMELTKREVELLERELKYYSLQQEVTRLRPLSGFYRIIKALAEESKLEGLLNILARETRTILKCQSCYVFVLEPGKDQIGIKLFDGPLNQPQKMPQFNNNIVHAVVSKGKVINLPDANKWDDKNLAPEGTFPESILCVPMFNKSGGVIGVIEALYKEGDNFSHDDEDWLKALAAIAAGSIEQAQSYAEIETFVDKTLETLAQTIDKRDPLTAGHSMRVTKYSLLIGQLFGLSKNDLEVLRYAAMMHDYGKIGVPEAILWKNGRLTPQEYALVQTHAKITYDLLINLPFTKHLVDVPYVASCHHEKLDGSGYYRGLKGDEIPLLARIITVADVFDALTSVRHYRNRMDISRVAEIMETGRGNHFDSKFVDIFFKSPCHKILQIMESEHKQDQPNNLKAFCQITLGRLIELCQGASPQPDEVGLPELFTQIYNEGLPPNYLALD